MKKLTIKERIEKLEAKAFGKHKKYKPVIYNGLMWSKIAKEDMSWKEAIKYAKNLREGGYKDWRLPTISELQNVFDYEEGKPKIKFSSTSNFWSSTERNGSQSNAWAVYLNFGYTNLKTKDSVCTVRCVRRDK